MKRCSTTDAIKRYGSFPVWGILLSILGACSHQPIQQSLKPTINQEISADYRIGPQDVLEVLVWKNDALSKVVTVRPDGKISLPLLDDVQAAGVTPKQLKADLTRRLAKYITSPEVSVIVREIRSRKVAVVGEVRKPGRYDVGSRASVLDAIALAGGFNDFARRSKMVILRVEGSTVTRIPCDYDKVVSNAQLETFLLRPGDTLIVP